MTSREDVETLVRRLTSDLLPASVVFAAVELRVFDHLREPVGVAALAEATGISVDAATRLGRGLLHLGLVTIAEGRVSATEGARAVLASDAPSSLAPIVAFQHRQLLPMLLHLADAARTGSPQHAAWPFADAPPALQPYDELAKHPAEARAFLETMDDASRGVGIAIAETGILDHATSLLDVGGGGGRVARELLRTLPKLSIESIDGAPACDLATQRSSEEGLAGRHRCIARDFRSESLGEGWDAVLLSAILADWPEDERALLLSKAAGALRRGGLLIVSETLFDDDRSGPPAAAMLSLVMLAAMRGDQLSARELSNELSRAGFVGVEVVRARPRDIVWARRQEA